MTDIGIYSARYGALVTWPLRSALQNLANGSVDIATERARVWSLLGGGDRTGTNYRVVDGAAIALEARGRSGGLRAEL